MPMAAGMFLTRHPELLEPTFAVSAGYMPTAKEGVKVVEPHRSSMQWTRRFIGLKLFLTLLVTGYSGHERMVRRMVGLGESLRRKLRSSGYRIVNDTPLPVVNFQDERHPEGSSLEHLKSVASRIADSGESWISVTSLGGRTPALRACVTNFRNREEDIDALIDLLERFRSP
jgi:aromatic-L-amino-acid decarboxylase